MIQTGKTAAEAVRGLTSLGPDRAGPVDIPALNRGRWELENRLQYVRDFSCDEDRSRMRSGALPRNLACLASAAISIVRLRGRFRRLPQTHRQGDACARSSDPPDAHNAWETRPNAGASPSRWAGGGECGTKSSGRNPPSAPHRRPSGTIHAHAGHPSSTPVNPFPPTYVTIGSP